MDLVNIGTIVNTKGVDGALVAINTLKNLTIEKGSKVCIGFSQNYYDEYLLAENFVGGINRTLLYIENIDSKSQAELLKEKSIFADRNEILEKNDNIIFPDEIIGCKMIDNVTNEIIGEIIEVWTMPANDVWVITTDNGKIPIPVIEDVIKEIDIVNSIIKIEMMDGLSDLAY